MCATRDSHSGRALSSAIFLIGLAVLFATDSFWPGILVLIAVTGLVKTLGRLRGHDDEWRLPRARSAQASPAQEQPAQPLIYPTNCPHCGASAPEVVQDARAGQKVVCEFCGATLQPMAAQSVGP